MFKINNYFLFNIAFILLTKITMASFSSYKLNMLLFMFWPRKEPPFFNNVSIKKLN